MLCILKFYFRVEHREEYRQPGGMCRPGRSCDLTTVNVGRVYVDINEIAPASRTSGADWINADLAALKHAFRRREQLRAMAHSGNWLARLMERLHQFQHVVVQGAGTRANDHRGSLGEWPARR